MSIDTSVFRVQVLETHVHGIGAVLHLKVRRLDDRDGITWNELQAVKNEVAGPTATAIEVFPPANRVVNDVNMRHLWVVPSGFPIPDLSWRA